MPASTDKLALPYPLPTDQVSEGAADIQALAERLELVVPRVTASLFVVGPPAAPVDGDEWVGLDAGGPDSGLSWRFRFNAGSTLPYKWEFVGGAPWYQILDVSAGTPILVNWNAATPSYSVVHEGHYDCMAGTAWGGGTPGALFQLGIGAIAPAWGGNNLAGVQAGTATGAVQIAAPAGGSIAVHLYCSAGDVSSSGRWLRVTPMRIA